MPVLMIGEVPNLTEEIYAGMVGQMKPLMRASKGFISHSGGPESVRRLAGRRDVGVRRGRPDMVRREREAQPPARHRPEPQVLPAPHRLFQIAERGIEDLWRPGLDAACLIVSSTRLP